MASRHPHSGDPRPGTSYASGSKAHSEADRRNVLHRPSAVPALSDHFMTPDEDHGQRAFRPLYDVSIPGRMQLKRPLKEDGMEHRMGVKRKALGDTAPRREASLDPRPKKETSMDPRLRNEADLRGVGYERDYDHGRRHRSPTKKPRVPHPIELQFFSDNRYFSRLYKVVYDKDVHTNEPKSKHFVRRYNGKCGGRYKHFEYHDKPSDPRQWYRRVDLPKFAVDDQYTGVPPKREVTISNLNDSVNRELLLKMARSLSPMDTSNSPVLGSMPPPPPFERPLLPPPPMHAYRDDAVNTPAYSDGSNATQAAVPGSAGKKSNLDDRLSLIFGLKKEEEEEETSNEIKHAASAPSGISSMAAEQRQRNDDDMEIDDDDDDMDVASSSSEGARGATMTMDRRGDAMEKGETEEDRRHREKEERDRKELQADRITKITLEKYVKDLEQQIARDLHRKLEATAYHTLEAWEKRQKSDEEKKKQMLRDVTNAAQSTSVAAPKENLMEEMLVAKLRSPEGLQGCGISKVFSCINIVKKKAPAGTATTVQHRQQMIKNMSPLFIEGGTIPSILTPAASSVQPKPIKAKTEAEKNVSNELRGLLPAPESLKTTKKTEETRERERRVYSQRTAEEEDMIRDSFKAGVDGEDEDYLKRVLEDMQKDGAVPFGKKIEFESRIRTYTPLELKTPAKFGKLDLFYDDPELAGIVPHPAGCARAQGFYRLTVKQKKRIMRRPEALQDRTEINERDEVVTRNQVQAQKEQRSMNRRLQTMTNLNPNSEYFKVNQLKYRQKKIKFARSRIHGWGLYALEAIAPDDVIVEYIGQKVRPLVAEHREKKYDRQGIGSSYLFRIDDDEVIDATKQGNVARFINHSCQPNCYAKVVTVDGDKRIVIYSKSLIQKGDEITYDYKFPIEGNKVECLCGAPSCKGTLN